MPQKRGSDQRSGARGKSAKDGIMSELIVRNSDHSDKDETDDRSGQKVVHQTSVKVSLAQDPETTRKDNNVDT